VSPQLTTLLWLVVVEEQVGMAELVVQEDSVLELACL
jgi:hypothetical protein